MFAVSQLSESKPNWLRKFSYLYVYQNMNDLNFMTLVQKGVFIDT